MNKNYFIILGLLLGCFQMSHAQFTLDGQFRPRTEYRNGFGSLIPEHTDAGFGVSTRVRLNAGYKTSDYVFYLSLQDVMVWGENRQILPYDQNNSFAVFEAWAMLKLFPDVVAKLGRQVLSYDDQRVLGGLDWAQQGRNHDAALIKYKKNGQSIDLAFAFNQDYSHPTGFRSQGTGYETTGFFSYKTMQMLHMKKEWTNFSASLLALNNGFQKFDALDKPDGVNNLQTLGTHLTYKNGNFDTAANAYLQTGDQVSSAYLLGLELGYKLSKTVKLGLGGEIISGDDKTTTKTEAFFPLYGTNHKFNGFMDYFYVGNHKDNIGLIDLHLSANVRLSDSSSLMIKALHFAGEQKTTGEKTLGTEFDLVYKKQFKGYTLVAGHSFLLPSDGMYALKSVLKNDAKNFQNWAWLMLVVKPKFLN